LRPQDDLLVANSARESNALVDEPCSDSQSARLRFYKEEPQLGGLLAYPCQEDASDVLAIDLGNPTSIPGRVIALHEISRDLRNEHLELKVPLMLPGVQRPVAMDDPADVTRFMLPQNVRGTLCRLVTQELTNRLHRFDEPSPIAVLEGCQEISKLVLRADIQYVELRSPGIGQPEEAPAAIFGRLSLLDHPSSVKLGEDSAQVAWIQVQNGIDLGRSGGFMLRHLVYHAGFRQREGAIMKSLAQNANPSCVEAVELSHGMGLSVQKGIVHEDTSVPLQDTCHRHTISCLRQVSWDPWRFTPLRATPQIICGSAAPEFPKWVLSVTGVIHARPCGILTEHHGMQLPLHRPDALEEAPVSESGFPRRSQMIHDLTRELASTVELDPLLNRIVAAAADVANSEQASVLLTDEHDALRFVAATNGVEHLEDIPVPIDRSVAGAAFVSREPQVVFDVEKDDRHFKAVSRRLNRTAHSLLAVPLTYKDRCIGVLEAENKRDPQGFGPDDIDALTLLAAQAAVAIENARMVEALRASHEQLEQRVRDRTAELSQANAALEKEVGERKQAEERARHLAHHDSLTGLPNRMLFFDRLEQAIALALRNRRSAAVMMLDVDRFKHINDSLGHDAGDALLCALSGRLRDLIRKSDTVARMGGDEFTIILPEAANLEDSLEVARKIIACFEEPFHLAGEAILVTTSVGVAMYPADGSDAASLMRSADTAMYEAKQAGRNCYRSYSRGM